MKLITFLGTGNYGETTYYFESYGKELGITTKYIQEALVKIIDEIESVVVVITDEARGKNWCGDNGEGLKSIFDSMNVNYELINIPSGKSQNELWEIFTLIYDNLEENEEILVDITHSFRSIPFIISSILNFSKEMKNILVKDVVYGAYEARDSENYSPIFHLSTYDHILDWSSSVSDLLNSGNYLSINNNIKNTLNSLLKEAKGTSPELKKLNKLAKNLQEYFTDLKLARGVSGAVDGLKIKENFEEINIDEYKNYESLKPFLLVINRLQEPFENFTSDFIRDIFNCIKMCKEYGLYQQAYTLLRENIVTYYCLEANVDIKNEKERMKVEKIILNNLNWEKRKMKNPIKLTDEEKEVESRIKNKLDEEKATLFFDLSDYRNDFNHAEYRLHPQKKKKIIEKLNYFSDEFYKHFILNKEVE